MFNDRKNEQKSSLLHVSTMSIFAESQKSKHYLINKLNTGLIEINNHVNNMNTGHNRDVMKYLLGASSFEDPYQLELMKKTLDNEIAILEKQRGKFTFRGCLTWSLCSLGISITNALFSVTEYRDSYGIPQLRMTNNLSAYAFLSSVAGGAAAIRAYIIESKISNINNIKNIILHLIDDNQRLVHLLDPTNPDELNFRQNFFEKYILPSDRFEQERKIRKETMCSGISYAEWNPSKSVLIPNRVGFAGGT